MIGSEIAIQIKSSEDPYLLLPFRFKRFPKSKILLVNEVGEFIFLNTTDFEKLISYKLNNGSELYYDLKAKSFISDSESELPYRIDLLATKYRTKKAYLRNFTSLHMVVITLRCNHRCNYCHASSQDADTQKFDMNIETARQVVETIFMSPSPYIKIEFQGGEPLLNFNAVKEIIRYAEKINKQKQKYLSFVLCTNLTLIDESILRFLKEHNVLISTSLDGSKDIHDANRILRKGGSSYDTFLEKLQITRRVLGKDKVSALMTVTKTNINQLRRVIDEYLNQDFRGVFLRSLNPYGYAKKVTGEQLNYPINEFIDAYIDAFEYIIHLNLQGQHFEEYFANILFTRILTPFSTGFMDLQSPAGAGILGTIYNFNGDVFPTDEARMLAAMGDNHFCLGNVLNNSYQEMFNGTTLRNIIKQSCVEIIPDCHCCPYQPYCGADPVRAYSVQKDKHYVGHIPTSEFCKKHKAIISYFMKLLEQNSEDVMNVIWAWITKRDINELKLS
jgi:His-Xaa-Ser system radical SAM maturase HxsB